MWTKFQICLVISLTLHTISLQVQLDESDKLDPEVEDALYMAMDAILEDLVTKYDDIHADDFWHPYDFGTGNENREVIRVQSMSQRHIAGDYLQWGMVKMGVKQYIVGLSANSVDVYSSKLEKIFSKDFSQESLQTMAIYTRWDADLLKPFMVILAATSEPNILIFKSTPEGELVELGSFPLHFPVKSIMLGQVDNTDHIVLVPENNQSPVTIYNIEITHEDGAQLWFFQRLSEPGFESAIVHKPDTADSVLIISKGDHLNVYGFDSEMGQFHVQQTVQLHDEKMCTNMFPFEMMYQHYIGCTGLSSEGEPQVHFINFNYNMNEYEESVSLEPVPAVDMFPIAIEGSRADLIFLSTNGGTDVDQKGVNVLTYDGQNKFRFDHQCSLNACSNLGTFSRGTSFVLDATTAFVFPTNDDPNGAPVMIFFTEVLARSSPVFQQSMGLFGIFKDLSERMNTWRLVVSEAEDTLNHKLNVNGDNTITGNWNVKSIATNDVIVNTEGRTARSDEIFNTLHFGHVQWTEEDFSATNGKIHSRLAEMDKNLAFIHSELNNNVLLKNTSTRQVVTANTIMKGKLTAVAAEITQYDGNILWDRDANAFFQSLVHKESDLFNIKGGLTFVEPVIMGRLQTQKINDVQVSDIARLNANNRFECSTSFENLETLGDVQATLVNSRNLKESVVMAENIEGFKLVDGVVAYDHAQTKEALPFGNVVLSSRSQTISSTLIFDEAVLNAPLSLGSLNSVDFKSFTDKIIFKNYQGEITGLKTFSGGANVETLFISNSWNGLKFPESFYTPSDEKIVLKGFKSFQKLNVKELIVNGAVDGVSTNDLVTLSGGEDIKATWVFNGPTKIDKDIEVARTVDGIVLESLVHTGVLDSSSLVFSPNADVVFEQPVHIQKLRVGSTINDKGFDDLFGDAVLFEGDMCVFSGKTTMMGDVVFGNINVKDDKINGFSTQNFLTKDTPQTITKPVILSGTTSFQELVAVERFDGVRILDVLSKAMRISEVTASTIPWDAHFESITCQDQFLVKGPVNNIRNFKSSVARTRGATSQTFVGRLDVERPVFTNLSTTHLILDLGSKLQTLDVFVWNTTRVKLSEPTFFSKPFKVNNILAKSDFNTVTVNDISIADLQEKVFRTDRSFQQFSGPIAFINGMTVLNGDVHFHEKVDDFFLDDFIHHGFPLNANNDQPIVLSQHWQFESFKMSEGLQTDGTNVCGVDLEQLQSDSVKRSDQNILIEGEKSFMKPLEVKGSLSTPALNGKSMKNVFRLKQENQNILEHATFAADVSKNKLDVNSINNVDMSWLAEIHSFRNGRHVINHDVFIKGDLITNSMHVAGRIQRMDLNHFLNSVYKLSDQPISFRDEITFEKPIVSGGNIQAGLYNGIDVTDLTNKMVRLDEDIVFNNPVSSPGTIQSVSSVKVGGNVDAKNLASGVDWNDMKANAIRINDKESELLLDNIFFHDVLASAPMQVFNLNGIPFENYATLSSLQNLGTLKVHKAFMEGSNVALKGNMGNVKISDEFRDTLMQNSETPQRLTGAVKIQGPITIKSDLNCFGPGLKNQIFTTHDDIILQGPVEFTDSLVIEKDVLVTRTIQGHDIDSIFANAFSTEKSGEQVVSASWEFRGPVTFLDNVTGRGLDGKMNIQSLVLEKEKELDDAKQQVAAERNRFKRKCVALHEIRNRMADFPVKLDSFDLHQTISVPTELVNVLAVETGETGDLMLLAHTTNCKLHRYQWHSGTELFHQVMEAPLTIGSIHSWQSIYSGEGSGIVVMARTLSECSDQVGLFSTTLLSDGAFSPLTLISEMAVKSFKLAKKADSIQLFVIFKDASTQLDVFEWRNQQFTKTAVITFGSTMERVDVTTISSGFGVLCHSKEEMHMYRYSPEGSQLLFESSQSILASTISPMAVFQNFDAVFALMPEPGTTPAHIQPTCNFQVLRFFNDGAVESIQKLQVPEVVSATHFTLAEKNLIAFLSKSHGLYIYEFKGVNGFEAIGLPSKVFEASKLDSFFVKGSSFTLPQPYMLTMTSNKIEVFRGVVFGDKFTADFNELCDS